mmetsp:Transcript_13889/g.19150  ORF Transcript_13889/g.19150 Transcript_13889/m.19150 type:complete len:628 (-) Transcript_13889:248-2131(-)|eukprot:CAMPEP_0201490238 /NCGR_PEP_ID=MMETSP0151_2-20130828/25663_1 /ASSEMBLY_ACC=CAM_ASM_000257 /TAXON_ID=200890 /ORGANISM="Paramoeba atlantica, Strain 621/1 / CCAP 1560/9" /LENGTH=627 /DNA_ID=CAMNT_0047876113 /DNA_START=188 /DNA_END=2071 /DNA_ORIENTATION=+
MSVAAPLNSGEDALSSKLSQTPPEPESQEKGESGKYSMVASAPPMEPPPLYFSPVPLGGEQLKETVASLVEYFLSRNYLEGDPYMVSQMNADRYLPVSLIVEKITSVVLAPVETEDVLNVISSSKDMSLDETRTLVCPNIKLVRNTIILRELPGIQEAEIRELFAADETLAKPTEITKEVSDCWFVSFDTESLALDALSFIRQQKYKGASIRARLKQESLLRSSYAVDPVNLPYFNPTPGDSTENSGQSGSNPWDSSSDRGQESKDHRRNQRFDRRGGRPQRKGRDFNSGGSGNVSGNANESGQGRHGYGHNNRNRRHAGGNGRKRVNSGKRGAPTPINLGLTHFPPLLNAQEKPISASNGHLKKWSKADLIAVIQALGDNPIRPGDLPSDCVAVLAAPNPGLEVSKPLPKIETVDLPVKSKHAPDYKAVVSAKPTPGKPTPKSSESSKGGKGNARGGGASPSGKGASGKGGKHKEEGEEEGGGKKNSKKDEKKDGEGFQGGKSKQKKRGGQKGEGKGKNSSSSSSSGSGNCGNCGTCSNCGSNSGNSASIRSSPKGKVEGQGDAPVAESGADGSTSPGPQAESPSGEGGQMSWARRVAKPQSSSPSPSSSSSASAEAPPPSLSNSQ